MEKLELKKSKAEKGEWKKKRISYDPKNRNGHFNL